MKVDRRGGTCCSRDSCARGAIADNLMKGSEVQGDARKSSSDSSGDVKKLELRGLFKRDILLNK